MDEKKQIKQPTPFHFQTPTEEITLPSKGECYPKDNLLSNGEIEIYYPDTSHEEILMSQKLIKNNTVIDKFLSSLIATPGINYNEMVPGDRSALMIAARILMYGKEYETEVKCKYCGETQKQNFDLTILKDADIDYELLNRENVYEFKCPVRKEIIYFKLLNNKDEKEIQKEIKFRKELNKKTKKEDNIDHDYSIRLKHMIIKIEYTDKDNNLQTIEDKKEIGQYKMLGRDSQEFKKYLKTMNPTIDTSVSYECDECGEMNNISLPMTTQFFWPTT